MHSPLAIFIVFKKDCMRINLPSVFSGEVVSSDGDVTPCVNEGVEAMMFEFNEDACPNLLFSDRANVLRRLSTIVGLPKLLLFLHRPL